MRFTPSSGLLLLAAAAAGPVAASPLYDTGYAYLEARQQCASYCGDESMQMCCGSSEVCATLEGNIATCVPPGGAWGAVTTTWTETRTYTSTGWSYWEPAPEPTAGVDCIPKNDDQEACGNICCAGWQTCAFSGQCSARSGFGEGVTVTLTNGGIVTTQYSAPFRITGVTTVTTTGVATETVTNTGEPTATETGDSDGIGAGSGDGDDGGLSAGAIAGIVIGSLVGVALLLLLCFCCIARGLWNAIFGRKKKTERSEVYEEHYSRHGSRPPSGYARRDRHTGWFGRPASASGRTEKKKSGGGWWLGLAGAAATMLALLNLRKDKKPNRRSGGSRYSNSYYSYTGTSPSSSSSGGRTHRTHRTQGSRGGSKYARSNRP